MGYTVPGPAPAMKRRTPSRDDSARHRPLERVKPLTLGGLAKRGIERIACACDWCRHEGTIEIAGLVAKMGAAATYRDVAERLVCSVCGWHGIAAHPIWPGDTEKSGPDAMLRDAHARKRVPLPSMDDCRAVLAATQIDSAAPFVERRSAYVRALMERWPDLTPSAALFVVQALDSGSPAKR